MKGWVETCAEIVGVKPKIILVDAKYEGVTAREWFPFRDIHLFGCTNKMNDCLGRTSHETLKSGLEKTFKQLSHQKLINEYAPSEVEQRILKNNEWVEEEKFNCFVLIFVN